MPRTLVTGAALAVAGALLVLLGNSLGLETESVALLGAALGAVIALVPDRGPFARLAGALIGFVVAWIGYALRAAVLPDSSGGRAVAVFLVIAVCVAVAAVTSGRLPLWTLLLGTAALSGGYELTFAAAPPEMVSTSVSTGTATLLALAIGFLAGSVASDIPSRPRATDGARPTAPAPHDDSEQTSLDTMMEKQR